VDAKDKLDAHAILKEDKGIVSTTLEACCGKGCCDSGPARVTAAHDAACHPTVLSPLIDKEDAASEVMCAFKPLQAPEPQYGMKGTHAPSS
jgi:hypothetical protein